MYKVNGRKSCTHAYARSYFCGRIPPEGLLYSAQRDLLAIAKFLVLMIDGLLIL